LYTLFSISTTSGNFARAYRNGIYDTENNEKKIIKRRCSSTSSEKNVARIERSEPSEREWDKSKVLESSSTLFKVEANDDKLSKKKPLVTTCSLQLQNEIVEDWDLSQSKNENLLPFRFVDESCPKLTPSPSRMTCHDTQKISEVDIAESDEQIAACWPVMRSLKPTLTQDEFVLRIKEQLREGYHLFCESYNGQVKSVAGVRIFNVLQTGKTLQIDDYCQAFSGESGTLLKWIVNYAQNQMCNSVKWSSCFSQYESYNCFLNNSFKQKGSFFELDLQ
jgi:hypothetical protein